MKIIHVIEDEEDILELVVYALNAAGFKTEGFTNGEDFYNELLKNPQTPALVIMDIMLPGHDGLTLLKRMRQNRQTAGVPVILLTAKSSELDKVKGLDLGADDYVTKPFGIMELMSRVNALIRRSSPKPEKSPVISYAGISIDDERRAVYAGGEKINLTYKEYSLLYYLLLNSERVLSREKIMDAVWGFDFEGESRTIDMHIRTLRGKLGAAGERIKTVRNVGYMLGV